MNHSNTNQQHRYELSSTEARKVMHEILRETLSGSGGRKAKDAFYPVGLKFDSKSCIGQISIGWSVGVALCNSGAVYDGVRVAKRTGISIISLKISHSLVLESSEYYC